MLRADVTLLLCATMPVAAQQPSSKEPAKAVETVEYKDASGDVTVRLPNAWKVKAAPAENGQIIALHVEIPGEKHRILFDVHSLPGVALRPEAQGWYELPRQQAMAGSDVGTVRSKPVPHLITEIKAEPKLALVIAMRRFRCRGIHVRFECDAKTWARPEVQGAFFTMAEGIQCKLSTLARHPGQRGSVRHRQEGRARVLHPEGRRQEGPQADPEPRVRGTKGLRQVPRAHHTT